MSLLQCPRWLAVHPRVAVVERTGIPAWQTRICMAIKNQYLIEPYFSNLSIIMYYFIITPSYLNNMYSRSLDSNII
jgi:hypothetical protein